MTAKIEDKAAPGVVGRENGCWCPSSESRPTTRCYGIDAMTGRFGPCDDCPVRWAKGADEVAEPEPEADEIRAARPYVFKKGADE